MNKSCFHPSPCQEHEHQRHQVGISQIRYSVTLDNEQPTRGLCSAWISARGYHYQISGALRRDRRMLLHPRQSFRYVTLIYRRQTLQMANNVFPSLLTHNLAFLQRVQSVKVSAHRYSSALYAASQHAPPNMPRRYCCASVPLLSNTT